MENYDPQYYIICLNNIHLKLFKIFLMPIIFFWLLRHVFLSLEIALINIHFCHYYQHILNLTPSFQRSLRDIIGKNCWSGFMILKRIKKYPISFQRIPSKTKWATPFFSSFCLLFFFLHLSCTNMTNIIEKVDSTKTIIFINRTRFRCVWCINFIFIF